MNYSNPIAASIRSVLRKLKINYIVSFLFEKILFKQYEERFDKALLKACKSGSTVWDIGANVGIYSIKFSKAVGSAGIVHAFEPHPATFKILLKNLEGLSNVKSHQIAVSNTNGSAKMSNRSNNALNAIAQKEDSTASNEENVVIIETSTGDTIYETFGLIPSLIKIDVEGEEVNVIKGMENIILNGKVEVIGIEVHHSLLKDLGYQNGAKTITDTLDEYGYKIDWIDPSHIVATKKIK